MVKRKGGCVHEDRRGRKRRLTPSGKAVEEDISVGEQRGSVSKTRWVIPHVRV